MTMANEQLESRASLLMAGETVAILLFDCRWVDVVIQDFRREGWTVNLNRKLAEAPPRIVYEFSFPIVKRRIKARAVS